MAERPEADVEITLNGTVQGYGADGGPRRALSNLPAADDHAWSQARRATGFWAVVHRVENSFAFLVLGCGVSIAVLLAFVVLAFQQE